MLEYILLIMLEYILLIIIVTFIFGFIAILFEGELKD